MEKRFVLVLGWFLLAALSVSASALGQDQFQESVKDDGAPEENTTAANFSAGGLLNSGNTENLQLNAGAHLEAVRGSHSMLFDVNYILGFAGDNYANETADNLRARGRYDYFFSGNNAAFVAAQLRRDPFAGLSPRVQGQVGYLRNFYKKEAHRTWGEVGYDITYDNFDYDLLVDAPDPADRPEDQLVHAARLYLGYDNHINDDLTYLMGVEGLLNMEDVDDLRINWDNAIRTSIGENLQAELKFSVQFDNVPVPGFKKTDTQTILNLIYTWM